ncbi:MAG: HEPN domain-containing protein [Defluviitaleaceae bacterium]|nr:HEPN domain-containing protein [Defluviitaleaceae bacterium]
MAAISYLEYSNRDYKYATGNFSLEYYDPCGRFCQQSAEKRMKHYIELNGNPNDMLILNTHNLGRLYDRVCALAGVASDSATRGNLSKLTDYYFDTNYPKELNIELTKEMAAEALEIAKSFNEWMDDLLAEEK